MERRDWPSPFGGAFFWSPVCSLRTHPACVRARVWFACRRRGQLDGRRRHFDEHMLKYRPPCAPKLDLEVGIGGCIVNLKDVVRPARVAGRCEFAGIRAAAAGGWRLAAVESGVPPTWPGSFASARERARCMSHQQGHGHTDFANTPTVVLSSQDWTDGAVHVRAVSVADAVVHRVTLRFATDPRCKRFVGQ